MLKRRFKATALVVVTFLFIAIITIFLKFSSAWKLYKDTKVMSEAMVELDNIKTEQECKAFLQKMAINVASIPEDLFRNYFVGITDQTDRQERLLSSISRPLDHFDFAKLKSVLESPNIKPWIKVMALNTLLIESKSVDERRILINEGLRMYLNQLLIFAPLNQNEIKSLFPEIENYLLATKMNERDLNEFKGICREIIEKIDHIPAVRQEFKDLHFGKVYIEYILYLCEPTHSNLMRQKQIVSRAIRLSENYLVLEDFFAKRTLEPASTMMQFYRGEIINDLKKYKRIQKNLESLSNSSDTSVINSH